MEQICADNNFGYDQSERLSWYNSIVKNGNKIRGAKGEFDCSSLVSAYYKMPDSIFLYRILQGQSGQIFSLLASLKPISMITI